MWRQRPDKERRYERFFGLLGLEPGDTVLDVGCGSAGDAVFLLDRWPALRQVIAVEPSVKALERALAQPAVVAEPRICLAAMDGRRLALPDASVGAAFCTRVLVHARDPYQILAEMVRVVRPGGRVLVVEPDRAGLLSSMRFDRVNQQFWATRRSLNPRVGIEAYGWMRALGLTDIVVEPAMQVQTTPPGPEVVAEVRRDLDARTGDYWELVRQGVVTAADLAGYADEVEALGAAGSFLKLDLEVATAGARPA